MMHRTYIILIFTFGIILNIKAQNLSNLFTNVDSIHMPGAAVGDFNITDPLAIPIISNSFCSAPMRHFAAVREYQSGKVMAIGHESLLSDGAFGTNDNASFILNAVNWLNSTNKNIVFKTGWLNNGNTSSVQNMLVNDGYSISSITTINSTTLTGAGILILGNDWNGNQPYSAAALTAIDNFVATGGAVLIAGLGWSWPNAITDYPMNQVSSLFGIEYTANVIYDAFYNNNGGPIFHNFYPVNMNPPASIY
jgi:hypothetical protein